MTLLGRGLIDMSGRFFGIVEGTNKGLLISIQSVSCFDCRRYNFFHLWWLCKRIRCLKVILFDSRLVIVVVCAFSSCFSLLISPWSRLFDVTISLDIGVEDTPLVLSAIAAVVTSLFLINSPSGAWIRSVPEDTAVSAVILPDERATLDTPSLGVGLADTTPGASPLPVAVPWGLGGPHNKTQCCCYRSSWFKIFWLCRHWQRQPRVVCPCSVRWPDLPRHRGSIATPVLSLSATAYSSIPNVWLISQLPCISTGRSPIRNLGTRPIACSCARESNLT